VFLGAFFYARVRFVSRVGFYFDQDTRWAQVQRRAVLPERKSDSRR